MIQPSKKLNQSSKKWSNLSNKELLEIYPVALQNAERHFRCAGYLNEASEHQQAIGHLILGAEEMIKSFACLLAGKEFNIRSQSWFVKVISNHTTRHDLIKDFFSFYKLMEHLTERSTKKMSFGMKVLDFCVKAVVIYNNYQWWENAEDLKKKSFYVDYLNTLLDPSILTKDDFDQTLEITQVLRSDLKKIMTKITGASPTLILRWQSDYDSIKLEDLRKKLNKVKSISNFPNISL